MRFPITKNQKAGDKKAFKAIEKQVLIKPDSLIGLASGKTTDGLHKLIEKDCKKNPKKWKKIKVFQIDENLGIPPESPLSFNYEVSNELKGLFKVLDKKNIFLIDGSKLPKKTISEAYNFIKKNGGIDLIVLGIGPSYDAHIAYNTVGKSTIKSKMRVVELHPKISKKLRACIDANVRASLKLALTAPPALTSGITLGIKDILDSKKALLIAYGPDKAKSIKLAFNGKVNLKKATASALQLHKNLEVVLDEEAAALLT